MKNLTMTFLLLLTPSLVACAGPDIPPLKAAQNQIDIPRFMGDWYVLAFIPIDLPFVSEAGAHNAVESYALNDDGSIATTYTFRDGAFDGPAREMTPKGFIHNKETNTEWRMQFVWPFRAAYLIIHVDEEYQKTIIGVPDRDYVWVMARSPDIPVNEYQALVQIVKDAGYDLTQLKRVPHRWPSPGA